MYYLLPNLLMLYIFRCAVAGSVCASPFPYNRGNVVCNAQIKTIVLAGIPLTLNAHFDLHIKNCLMETINRAQRLDRSDFKCHSSILPTSNRQHFQSVFIFHRFHNQHDQNQLPFGCDTTRKRALLDAL